MSKFPRFLFALTLLVMAFTPLAQANQALANAKGCLACHDIKAKKIGPAYQDVAKKYAGQADATAKLTQKVLEGGSGVWGESAMPAFKTTGIAEADVKKLVAWILTLK